VAARTADGGEELTAMKICQEIGRWITENVEQPLEQFFTRAYEVCSEVRRWVER